MRNFSAHTKLPSIVGLPAIGLPALALATMLASCTPTVQVAVPNEPITINLNVRIEHEIRVQVEEDLDGIFSADSGLF